MEALPLRCRAAKKNFGLWMNVGSGWVLRRYYGDRPTYFRLCMQCINNVAFIAVKTTPLRVASAIIIYNERNTNLEKSEVACMCPLYRQDYPVNESI